MKQPIVALLLLLTAVSASAQRNPVEGYIITNQNDTIRGTIDYRTTSENCSHCFFMAKGETEYKRYQPQDIRGYRFSTDGVYYASKTISIDNAIKEIFAEFLVQGGVSLLHYVSPKRQDYFLLIGENGQEVVLKDDAYNPNTRDAADLFKLRLDKRKELFPIFEKSVETLDQLCQTPYNSENLASMVHTYDETFCNDEMCIRYEYDRAKSRSFEARFFVEAGLMVCDYVDGDTPGNKYYPPLSYDHSFVGPRVGLGVQLHSDRSLPALYYNLKFNLGYGKMNGWTVEGHSEGAATTKKVKWSDELWLLELSLGAEYHILHKKQQTPFITAGINSIVLVPNGFYGGVGYEFAVGRHKLRLVATYNLTLFKDADYYRRNHFNAEVGFVF